LLEFFIAKLTKHRLKQVHYEELPKITKKLATFGALLREFILRNFLIY